METITATPTSTPKRLINYITFIAGSVLRVRTAATTTKTYPTYDHPHR